MYFVKQMQVVGDTFTDPRIMLFQVSFLFLSTHCFLLLVLLIQIVVFSRCCCLSLQNKFKPVRESIAKLDTPFTLGWQIISCEGSVLYKLLFVLI